MAAAGATLDSVDGLARLWTHESLRVFGDRLVDDQDRRWFAGALKSAMETHFRLKWCVASHAGSSGQHWLTGCVKFSSGRAPVPAAATKCVQDKCA